MSVLLSVLWAAVIAAMVRALSRRRPLGAGTAGLAGWSAIWAFVFSSGQSFFIAAMAALLTVGAATRSAAAPVRGAQVFLPQPLRRRAAIAGVCGACCAVFLLLLGPLRSWTASIIRPGDSAWADLPSRSGVWSVLAMGIVLLATAYLCLRRLRGVADQEAATEVAHAVVRTVLVVLAAATGWLSATATLHLDGLSMSSLLVPAAVLVAWALFTRPHGVLALAAQRRDEQATRHEREDVPSAG